MEIECTQCGAPVAVGEGVTFLPCTSCGSALCVDLRTLCLHYRIQPLIRAPEIAGILTRWLAQREVAGAARLSRASCRYWPFWEVDDGRRRLLLLAAASPYPELEGIDVTAGTREFYQELPDLEGEVVQPEIFGDAARRRFQERGGNADRASLTLLHLPLYEVTYTLAGQTYQALVDGLAGEVHATETPPASVSQLDARHAIVFSATLVIFVIEGLLIPGFWPTLAAYAATGAGLYVLYRQLLMGKLKG